MVVRLLVERKGVEDDSKDSECRMPPWHAALYGHEAVVKLLVELDEVEANFKDNDGRTPLFCSGEGERGGREAASRAGRCRGRLQGQ